MVLFIALWLIKRGRFCGWLGDLLRSLSGHRTIASSIDCGCAVQALPAWNVLLLAREPVALSIADCSKNDIVMAASGAKVCAPLQPSGLHPRLIKSIILPYKYVKAESKAMRQGTLDPVPVTVPKL